MELNWKLMSNVDAIVDQRNSLYEVLNRIYEDVHRVEGLSQVKQGLEKILTETPNDFRVE